MSWVEEKLGVSDCVLEYLANDKYKAQAEVIGKVPIYGQKLFGDYDICVTVFNEYDKAIETKEMKGLNGNYKMAYNSLNKLKQEIQSKYFQ